MRTTRSIVPASYSPPAAGRPRRADQADRLVVPQRAVAHPGRLRELSDAHVVPTSCERAGFPPSRHGVDDWISAGPWGTTARMVSVPSLRRLAGRLGAVVLVTIVAAALAPAPPERRRPVRPSPTRAYQDLPALHHTDCVVTQTSRAFKACRFGDRNGRRTLVLVGDSKAAQWFTPLERIAKAQTMAAGGHREERLLLRPGDPAARRPAGPRCEAWSAKGALRTIKQLRPDVVVPVTRWGDGLPPAPAAVSRPSPPWCAGWSPPGGRCCGPARG